MEYKGTVKMADLARMAGVSKSTVSRALAGSPLIPSETKDRIISLAKEHNYRLNKRARNFRTRQALTIAVLIPDTQQKHWRLSDPFFLELLGSIADCLNDKNHELLLAKSSVTTQEWVESHIEQGTCDGVILIGQGTRHDEINRLAEGDTSFVVWGGLLADQKYCTVGSNNRLGGEKASMHLLEKGCQHIAFLGDRRLPEAALRYEGYAKALRDVGISIDPNLEVSCPFGGEEAYQAVARLLSSGQKVDGIFASSDVIAMATIRALSEQNLRIPEDVAIVGYDDVALASYYSPPLTTIRQDCGRGGQELVARLLDIIDGKDVSSLMLETDIVIRAST